MADEVIVDRPPSGFFSCAPADLLRDPARWDPRLALAAAEHAVAVYRLPGDYGLECRRAGYISGQVIERGAAQVGLAWTREVIVVTPRGTSEWMDVWYDLASVVKRRWRPYVPEGRIGAGFRRQAMHVGDAMLENLCQLLDKFPDAEVVINGHSLGGSLASHAAAFLAYHDVPVRAVFAFSAPRGGNAKWACWYDETVPQTWSIVNAYRGELDIISRVPKRSWGFEHVGQRVIITSSPDPRVFRGEAAWQEYRALNPVGSLAAWRVLSRRRRGLQAHYGAALLESLSRVVEIADESPDP